MASQSEATRTIRIRVENLDGLPLVGSTVEILIDGEPCGSFTSGFESTVEVDAGLAVELRASAAQFTTMAVAEPFALEQVLVVPTTYGVELASVPTARCPEGTSGQPCVTCTVQGRRIRICA